MAAPSSLLTWLDKYFTMAIQAAGVGVPDQATLNFGAGLTVTPDPANGRNTVSVSSSPLSVSGTGLVRVVSGTIQGVADLGAADTVLTVTHAGTDRAWSAPGPDVRLLSGVWNVVGLQGYPVASTPPSSGQVMAWSGTAWTSTSLGSLPLAGDVTGTLGANDVAAISGSGGAGGAVALGATVVLTAAAGAGGLALGSWTGDTVLTTGNLTYAAASGKVISISGYSNSDQITLGHAALTRSAWTPTQLLFNQSSSVTSLATLTLSGITLAGVVGSSTVLSLAAGVGDYLSFGAVPALSGAIRLANTQAITARNAANTADFNLVTVDGSNDVIFGDFSASDITYLRGGGGITLQGASYSLQLVDSAPGTLAYTGGNFQFSSSTATPLITQAGTGPANGAANALTFAPQAPNATNGTPGAIKFAMANPTGTGGSPYVQWTQGGTQVGLLTTGGVANGGLLTLGTATQYAIQGDGSGNTHINGAGGTVLIESGATPQVYVFNGGLVSYADLGVVVGSTGHRFSSAVIQQGISAGTSTTGAGTAFNVTSEAAKVGSAGAGGNIGLWTGQPDGAGANGTIQLGYVSAGVNTAFLNFVPTKVTPATTTYALGDSTHPFAASYIREFATIQGGGSIATQNGVVQQSVSYNSTTDHFNHTYQSFTLAAHTGASIKSRAVARVTTAGTTLVADQVIAAEAVCRCYWTGTGSATVGTVSALWFDGSTGPSSGTPWLVMTVTSSAGVVTVNWTKTSEATDAHLDIEVITTFDYC